jgi:hypothetical protein
MLTLTKNYAVKTGQPRKTNMQLRKYACVQIYEKYLVIVIKVHLQNIHLTKPIHAA